VRRRTVILDLDGTLIDVSKRHYSVYQDVLAELGGRALPFERYWELKRAGASWPEIMKSSELGDREASAFLGEFRSRIEQPRYLALDAAFSFTHEVMDGLSAHDVHLVTLRQSASALRQQLRRLDLIRQFGAIASGQGDGGAQTKAELIGKIPRGPQAIVVGDTEVDVEAARKLDAVAVAVTSGLRSATVLERSEPDLLIEDIRSLPEIVGHER
jgi:phosphoglycolate phosphatase